MIELIILAGLVILFPVLVLLLIRFVTSKEKMKSQTVEVESITTDTDNHDLVVGLTEEDAKAFAMSRGFFLFVNTDNAK